MVWCTQIIDDPEELSKVKDLHMEPSQPSESSEAPEQTQFPNRALTQHFQFKNPSQNDV